MDQPRNLQPDSKSGSPSTHASSPTVHSGFFRPLQAFQLIYLPLMLTYLIPLRFDVARGGSHQRSSRARARGFTAAFAAKQHSDRQRYSPLTATSSF
jgi:hypothetical protein